MEFVSYQEVMEALEDHGIRPGEQSSDECLLLSFETEHEPVSLHLACNADAVPDGHGSNVIVVDQQRLPGMLEQVIHKLHLSQILLIPAGKWRNVFDAVAFSLADNEDWQEVDAAATVELNTRDPLLCGPGDLHTLTALIAALLEDAETREQGMTIATTAAPLIAEVNPAGAITLTIGDPALADEINELFQDEEVR